MHVHDTQQSIDNLEVRNHIAADVYRLQTLRNGAAGVAGYTLLKHANA